MTFVYPGASMECEHGEIFSRKIIVGSLIKIKDVGLCIQYKCQQNSEATNKKELNPKEAIVDMRSHIDLDDCVRGEDLVIYIKGSIKLKIDLVNLTGRHKAQKMNSKKFTHAKISKAFPNLSLMKDPKQLELAKKQLE